MDNLRDLFVTSGAVDTVPVIDMVQVTLLAFFLSLIVGYVYRITHQGPSYSQTTVHTMVIMTVVVALIMLVIGTNIARAFSLVGALSIIRFRNAVKESRDVAFFFLSMAIGMACGTGFLAIAMIFTLIVCPMIYFMSRFQIGAKPVVELMLRMTVNESMDFRKAFNDVFYRYLENADLLSVDSDGSGKLELIYTITLRRGQSEPELLSELGKVDNAIQAQLIPGQGNILL